MKHKTKSKTLEKPKRNTRKTIKKKSKSPDRPVSMETIKKREQRGLVRTIQKYENNLTNLIKNSYYENPLLVSKLLMVALFPQITNSTNIHHYQEYFMLLQTDNNFKDMVDVNEAPETDLDNNINPLSIELEGIQILVLTNSIFKRLTFDVLEGYAMPGMTDGEVPLPSTIFKAQTNLLRLKLTIDQ